MVDSVIADLGHRHECVGCKAIALRKGDLSNLTLSQGDLPEVPWGAANQSILFCPSCPTLNLQEVVYSQRYPEPLFFCQGCKAILISHESLGRIRRHRLKLEIKDDYKNWMDPHEGILALLAFPACIILAWLCDVLVLPAMLLKGIDIQFHELGHTLVSWLTGTPAVPMAIVTIPFKFPKLATYGVMAIGLFFWTSKGRQESLRAFTAFFYGMLALQAYLTFMITPNQASEYIILGGVLGQFFFPLVLGLAYYYQLPKFWNWTYMRYGVLLVAIYCLEHNAEFWSAVAKGKMAFPSGSLISGPNDANGDMNRLIGEFGWTESFLGRGLNLLGLFCRSTLWGHFIFRLFRKNKKTA